MTRQRRRRTLPPTAKPRGGRVDKASFSSPLSMLLTKSNISGEQRNVSCDSGQRAGSNQDPTGLVQHPLSGLQAQPRRFPEQYSRWLYYHEHNDEAAWDLDFMMTPALTLALAVLQRGNRKAAVNYEFDVEEPDKRYASYVDARKSFNSTSFGISANDRFWTPAH